MRDTPTLEGYLKDLITDLQEIKARQLIGRDSLLSYRYSSNDLYDITNHLSMGGEQTYRLTFTHAEARYGAILALNVFYRLDNSNVMASPALRNPPTNPHVTVSWYKESAGADVTSWIIQVTNISFSLTPVAYLKLFIDGTDTGTWTIDAI